MLAQAAMRSVTRALVDAPRQIDLVEAVGALMLRFGNSIDAEARILAGLDIAPDRGTLWALLCEARRARNDLSGARAAVQTGIDQGIKDPLLFTEDGLLHLEGGDRVAAAARFREVLARWPFFPSAWKHLAQIALADGDSLTSQWLVDGALAAQRPLHPDVLRQAIELALRAESPGVARAARILSLARALVLVVPPQDAAATLVLARALIESGNEKEAIAALMRVESAAKGSPLAAEVQRDRFQIEEKPIAEEVQSIFRASREANDEELNTLAARARRISESSSAWVTAFTLGVVLHRQKKLEQSEEALNEAIARSGGMCPRRFGARTRLRRHGRWGARGVAGGAWEEADRRYGRVVVRARVCVVARGADERGGRSD